MALNDDIRTRETEQARLTTYLRQRDTLEQTTACTADWREAQLADLDVCIAATRSLIAEAGDRILDAYRTDHPLPA